MVSEAITLSWHEAAMASHVGWMRQVKALASGRPDKHGFEGAGWSEHCEGACGELALARSLNIYWDGSVDTFKAPDVGPVQVRTRSRHNYELLVRDADSDDEVFVLITGLCPAYRIHGWLSGREAKQTEFLQTYGNRPAAYFVPQSHLNLMKDLNLCR